MTQCAWPRNVGLSLSNNASDTLDDSTSGKKLTDVRKNGNLRWLRRDGNTRVTIAYDPQVMAEIVEVA